jgi:hypothetical protein
MIMMTDDEKFELFKALAHTIGTHTLTIMLHEHHGRTEYAEIVRGQRQKLEDQLRRRIELFYAMKEDQE